MDDLRYQHLITELELQARTQPRWYRGKVIGISVLLYVLVGGLLLLQTSILLFVLSEIPQAKTLLHKIGLALFCVPILFLLWSFGRAVFFRQQPSTGIPLTAATAPDLFRLLEKIRRKLNAPKLTQVILNQEFNAGIQQIPRWGLFGGYRHYLILGLPLLQALPPAEFMAILAHEYAHITHGDGKFDGWIYRQRHTFAVLIAHAETPRHEDLWNGSLFFLLNFFAPYYNAITFVLSRQQEYEADALAARFVGKQAVKDALIRIHLLARWLDECFWPKLYAQAEQRSEPAFFPHQALPTALKAGQCDWQNPRWLKVALDEDSDLLDTHPCLRERLEALSRKHGRRQDFQTPELVPVSAAEQYLGATASKLGQELDANWWEAVASDWQQHSRDRQRGRARMYELDKLDPRKMQVHEVQEYAVLLMRDEQLDKAKQLLETLLLRRDGSHLPMPTMLFGQLLLQQNNPKGISYLEKALTLSPSLGEECLASGHAWLLRFEGKEAAERWRKTILRILQNSTQPPSRFSRT